MAQRLVHSNNWFADIAPECKRLGGAETVVLVDENVYPSISSQIEQLNADLVLIIKVGENNKTLRQAESIWRRLFEAGISRAAIGIVIGGGMTLDIGGYVCAAWKRGIQVMYIPTSLVAMADACIGGKVGVNFEFAKNLIGTYRMPHSTIIDVGFLNTLPERELRAGLAEMLKHGLIADASYWRLLVRKPLHRQNWPRLVKASQEIKLGIVIADPKEHHLRKVLNYGHTLGHALESLSNRSPFAMLHGEAIAWGMRAEARLSVEYGGLKESAYQQIAEGLSRFAFPAPQLDFDRDMWANLLRQDKKNAGESLRISLLAGIGFCTPDIEVPMAAALDIAEEELQR